MMLLPKDLGPFTLVRKLGAGVVAESYFGTLRGDEARPVVVRRVLPYILRDPGRLASTEARVRDLIGVRHPFLVQVLDWVEDGDERFMVEDRVDGVDLDRLLAWCRAQGQALPHNVFLNVATQICNGLEALHGRSGKGTGADNVLHLGLRPGAVLVARDGKVVLGGYGLTRSPTSLSHGGVSAPVPSRMEYLSPEQTQPDQKLGPASDIFSLGALLYELLTLEPLFRSDSNLQTINRIRKAEVTSQLLKVKELMPGLDKILYRALSLNPKHRYQRAFVLREDLRGLMAGYSFATINEDTRAFLAPLLEAEPTLPAPVHIAQDTAVPDDEAALPGEDAAQDPGRLSGPGAAPAPMLGAMAAAEQVFDDFSEEVATRIERNPSTTAAIAAEALRAQLDAGQAAEDAAGPPLDEVPALDAAPPSQQEEELADRNTLPLPPEAGAGRDDEKTDHARELLDPGPANSTRAFLRGQGVDDAAPPPSADPDPSASGIGLLVGGQLAAPPVVPVAPAPPPVPVVQAAAPPVPPPVATVAPVEAAHAAPRPIPPSDIAHRAPPPPGGRKAAAPPAPAMPAPAPAAVAPPPAVVTPAPRPPELDEAPPRKRGNGLVIGVAVGVIGLVLACGLGSYGLSRFLGGVDAGLAEGLAALDEAAPAEEAPSAEEAPAAEEAAPAAPPPSEEEAAPAEEAVAAVEQAPPPVVEEEEEEVERVAVSRPPPASSRSSSASPTTSSSRSSSTSSSSSRSASTSSSRASEDAVADLDLGEEVAPTAVVDADLEKYASPANKGKLTSSDVMALEMVTQQDPAWSRSRALLLMNAQRKGDEASSKRYLDQLMTLPENQYNPVYLSDLGRYHVNKKQYDKALEKATLAERYWARLPPELVFSKKAEIFETQAAAWQGRFYQSGDDMEMLDQAIRHWQKYRDHVQTKSRSDLARRADAELAKLEDIRTRLQ